MVLVVKALVMNRTILNCKNVVRCITWLSRQFCYKATAAICVPFQQMLLSARHLTLLCVGQVEQQLEAQQAQHAVKLQDLSSKADEMESRLQQAIDLDQQHVTQLTACEADLAELRQVGSDPRSGAEVLVLLF